MLYFMKGTIGTGPDVDANSSFNVIPTTYGKLITLIPGGNHLSFRERFQDM